MKLENYFVLLKLTTFTRIIVEKIKYNIHIPCRCVLPLIRDKLLEKAEEYGSCLIS